MNHRGPQYFTNADFFCTLDGNKHCQAHEAETCNQNRQAGKDAKHPGCTLLLLVHFIDFVIEEVVFERQGLYLSVSRHAQCWRVYLVFGLQQSSKLFLKLLHARFA